MWDLIVTVPDHCLSFYFIYLFILDKILVSTDREHHETVLGYKLFEIDFTAARIEFTQDF